jgi:hypothetical protein
MANCDAQTLNEGGLDFNENTKMIEKMGMSGIFRLKLEV